MTRGMHGAPPARREGGLGVLDFGLTAEIVDDALLARWKAGDVTACEALVERHFTTVYRFFRSKLDEDLTDLTQQTFAACLAARVDLTQDFRGFLLGIARKQLLMHLRKRYRKDRAFRIAEASVDELSRGPGTPSQVVFLRERQRSLLAALRRLPLDQQIALELFYWEELPVAEIASVLGIRKGTVMSRLGRGREQLRAQMTAVSSDPAFAADTVDRLDRWAESVRNALEPAIRA